MKQLPDNKQSDGFSLVPGGPLFQLFIRARINTTTPGLLKRRVIVFFLFTWLPCRCFRIFLWARVLWQVSRLDLHRVPTHPDGAAGFGFLGGGAVAFMPLLLSQGTLFAGQIANHIFHEGPTLLDFKPETVGCVIFLLLLVLGPLCMAHWRTATLTSSSKNGRVVQHCMRAAIVLKTAIAVSVPLPVKRRGISRLAQADLMHAALR
ncbi:MAG: hypothetical protein Q8L79_19705 [Methylobacter sp.]|uniref:hypothetical protein n=1 Tax=Methylobacter sp. TaxID=2051955 RepID=UPI002731360D|nr:hypothetical protein [Methylobacter sp.]MDP1667338.1 hypothetical protein [Methylobacter sp.]